MLSKTNVLIVFILLLSYGTNAQEQRIKQSFYFKHDSAQLTVVHQKMIDSLNNIISKDSIKIDIKGYANNYGTKNYNLILSNARATHVKNAFLNTSNTAAVGLGALNNTASKSRRVDVVISVFKKQIALENEQEKHSITTPETDILDAEHTVKVGEKYVLNGILFKGAEANFLSESFSELEKLY